MCVAPMRCVCLTHCAPGGSRSAEPEPEACLTGRDRPGSARQGDRERGRAEVCR